MKKTSMVLIMLVGSIAFASSLSIPWYVDTAPVGTNLPPEESGGLALIYLKSTVDRVLTCEIAYYNSAGQKVGPFAPAVNTFTIQPMSALGFRPVADDPAAGLTSPWGHTGTNKGQEGIQAMKVPNRPFSPDTSTAIPNSGGIIDVRKNGSITISWTGPEAAPTDIQGSMMSWNYNKATGVLVSFSHLLPPGK